MIDNIVRKAIELPIIAAGSGDTIASNKILSAAKIFAKIVIFAGAVARPSTLLADTLSVFPSCWTLGFPFRNVEGGS